MNELEPQLDPGIPECPDYLDDTARKEWGNVSKLLAGMKVLTKADYIALGNLCQAYSILIAAQKQLNKTGILFKTKSGYVQQSPLLGIITAQTTIVNNLCREFGLTPSSRTRIATVSEEKKPANRFAALGEKPQPSVN